MISLVILWLIIIWHRTIKPTNTLLYQIYPCLFGYPHLVRNTNLPIEVRVRKNREIFPVIIWPVQWKYIRYIIYIYINILSEKVFNILISSEPAGCLSPLDVKPYTGTVVSCIPKVTFILSTNSWNKNSQCSCDIPACQQVDYGKVPWDNWMGFNAIGSIWTTHTLTHGGGDEMTAMFQTTYSITFSWMKKYEFRLKFHWSLFLSV